MGLYQGDNLLSSIGKSPAAYAKDNGYTGTDDEFYSALADMPGHLDNKENPHGVTAAQVGADASGAAATALANAKSYTDQEVANATPGTATKDSPTDSDSLFIYDNADSSKPKKTLISKLVELFNNTFYSKTETDTLLQDKADTASVYTKGETYTKAETDTLLQNKAPAGFGLGTAGKRLYSSDDLSTIWESGFYSWGGYDVPTNFIDNAPSAFWVSCMEVISYGDGAINIQRVWGLDTTSAPILVQRAKYGNTIRKWEYGNPPMELGVEYRTTERWNGKPVYVIAVDFGPLPNNTVSSTSIPGWVSTNRAFSVNVVAHGSTETVPVPVGLSSDYSSSYWYINNPNGKLYIRSRMDLSGYTSCYVYLKYTKA